MYIRQLAPQQMLAHAQKHNIKQQLHKMQQDMQTTEQETVAWLGMTVNGVSWLFP